MSDKFLYFGYGSNMPSLRIQKRCPSARFVGLATLPNYELRWHKPSTDGSGKCDVVPSKVDDSEVIGVLFEINNFERHQLDQDEKGYKAICLDVFTADGARSAVVYIAEGHDPARRPYTWYKDLVLLGGKQHRLPEAYLDRIESVAADVDPNDKRRLQRELLIEEVRKDIASRSISDAGTLS